MLRGGVKALAVCGAANTDAGGNTLFGGTEEDRDDGRELQPCNCCDAGGTGCDCGECEEAVCDFDGYCCDNWDASCAILASKLCDCCAGQSPGECGNSGD